MIKCVKKVDNGEYKTCAVWGDRCTWFKAGLTVREHYYYLVTKCMFIDKIMYEYRSDYDGKWFDDIGGSYRDAVKKVEEIEEKCVKGCPVCKYLKQVIEEKLRGSGILLSHRGGE